MLRSVHKREATHAPVADFVHYCDGLSCFFDGSSSTGVGLRDSGIVWLLDSGSATSAPTRSHTLFTSGAHTVEIQVTDARGSKHRLRCSMRRPSSSSSMTCDEDRETPPLRHVRQAACAAPPAFLFPNRAFGPE